MQGTQHMPGATLEQNTHGDYAARHIARLSARAAVQAHPQQGANTAQMIGRWWSKAVGILEALLEAGKGKTRGRRRPSEERAKGRTRGGGGNASDGSRDE